MTLNRWLARRREVVCRDFVELVTAYLEGALSDRQRTRFEAHLSECPFCEEYLEQIRLTVVAAGKVRADDLALEVRDELVSLYRRWQGSER